ncbi:MAG TPA: hypothetical protein VMR33_15845 [Candidatus Baltobacteraceae bacterium]|nr:hypothetical protein [Candidatus Baltobacteraceae bacterium]
MKLSLAEYRQEIRRLFAQHPDAKLFGSLSVAGDKNLQPPLMRCGSAEFVNVQELLPFAFARFGQNLAASKRGPRNSTPPTSGAAFVCYGCADTKTDTKRIKNDTFG